MYSNCNVIQKQIVCIIKYSFRKVSILQIFLCQNLDFKIYPKWVYNRSKTWEDYYRELLGFVRLENKKFPFEAMSFY